jgi:anti-sigma factor RsiW
MSGHSPSCADVHDLTPGFAFGALDPDEQRIIDQHCADCPSCAATLHQARQTAVMLSFAVRPISPPPIAKAELFARIAHQGLPATPPLSLFPSAQTAARGISSATISSGPGLVDSHQHAGRFHFPFPARIRRGTGDRPRFAWSALTVPFAATVPLVLALFVMGAFAVRSQSHVDALEQDLAATRGKADRLQSTLATIDSLVADANSRVYFLPPQNATNQQGYGKVYTKPGAAEAVLMVWGLQSTTNGTGYQVMLESRSGKMVRCGSFRVDRHGNGSVLLSFDQPFTAYESVRVMPMPSDSIAKSTWANTEFLSAPINPIVGQPGDTDLPPTQ